MRILMLHNRYLVPGGEDQSTAAEVGLLRDHGHEVELLEQDNHQVEQMGRLRTAFGTLWSSRSYQTIREKLKASEFDVMHVQNFFPLWSPAVYYAAAHCGVPVVQTLRNYRLMCVNALFFREGHVCEECLGRAVPWHGIVHACYRDSRAGSTVLAGMVGLHKFLNTWKNKVDVYIALTDFARSKFIQGGFPAEKIVVKSNFVHPPPAIETGGGNYALFVGRLGPEKGIATMLEAWKTAHSPIPLKVVGDGPLAEMVKTAARINQNIEFLGHRSPPEVLDVMRNAEFLVFPSEWYEGMPRTVIEALSVGTPVLATNIGATASMVVPGQNGFHFAPGDVEGLRTLVVQLCKDLAQVRGLRSKARASFDEHYTGTANIAKLIAIYRQAIGKAKVAKS